MNPDERFHRLNKIDEHEYPLITKAIVLVGFTTLERINKLIPYGEINKINVELDKYFMMVDELLAEAEKNKTRKGLQPNTSKNN